MEEVMTATENRNCQITIVLLCFAAAGQTQAKNTNHAPDMASDDYWDKHNIAIVRVAATGTDDGGTRYVTYEVETLISEAPLETPGTVPLSHLWFGSGAGTPGSIAANDRFVFYYAKQEPSPIVAARLDLPGASRLVMDLQAIAKLRQNPSDQPAYLSGVFTGDSLVSQYCLRHLLNQPPARASGADLARLLRLRDDVSQDMQARMLANRVANRLAGGGDQPDAEYSWLQATLAAPRAEAWPALKHLVQRMFDFQIRRSETVDFLTRLVLNPAAPLDARIAAYGAFENPRIFLFDAPDAISQQVFETCVQMLQDPEPVIRGAGAALLRNISVAVSPAVSQPYFERSRAAISDALAVESDGSVRALLVHYLALTGN
jgi:hypothetical protein